MNSWKVVLGLTLAAATAFACSSSSTSTGTSSSTGAGSSSKGAGSSTSGTGAGSSSGSGSSASGGSTVSCNVAASHWCFNSKNVPSSLASNLQTECTSAQNGVVGTGCPTADVVGCCSALVDGYTSEECYYSGGSSTFTAATVMADECIDGSTFSATP